MKKILILLAIFGIWANQNSQKGEVAHPIYTHKYTFE